MITLEQAKNLQRGDVLHTHQNGKLERWRVNGMVKTWKRSPERVRIPVKFGLYDHDYVTEHELELVSLEGSCDVCDD